jgi:hypothetical protein
MRKAAFVFRLTKPSHQSRGYFAVPVPRPPSVGSPEAGRQRRSHPRPVRSRDVDGPHRMASSLTRTRRPTSDVKHWPSSLKTSREGKPCSRLQPTLRLNQWALPRETRPEVRNERVHHHGPTREAPIQRITTEGAAQPQSYKTAVTPCGLAKKAKEVAKPTKACRGQRWVWAGLSQRTCRTTGLPKADRAWRTPS